MESDDAPRSDGNLFPRFWIAARTLRLVTQLKIAESGKFDGLATLQGIANFVKESFNHVFCFTLVKTNLLEQKFGKFCLGQRREIFFRLRTHFGLEYGAFQVSIQHRLKFA